jgi:hypothetical protein
MTAKQRAARAKFKAVVKEAQKLRKKNPKLTQAQAVKQAWAISYSKKRAGVGAVKKKAAPKKKAATKVKAKKSKRTSEMHTDTKSHNVNIRVVSGINDQYIKDLREINDKIQKWIIVRHGLKEALISSKDNLSKTLIRNDLYRVKNVIAELKERLSRIKKQIK